MLLYIFANVMEKKDSVSHYNEKLSRNNVFKWNTNSFFEGISHYFEIQSHYFDKVAHYKDLQVVFFMTLVETGLHTLLSQFSDFIFRLSSQSTPSL